MKLTVKTQSGSTYILDSEAMTWERVVAGDGSNYVRTSGGQLTTWPTVVVGRRADLYGPPLDPTKDVRWTSTSEVLSIEES